MIDQTFSARNFLRLTTRLDPKKYKLGRNREDYLVSLEKVSAAVLSDDFKFSSFSVSRRAGKPVYSVTTHIDEFAIRKLGDNLSRVYGVQQANRTEIVGQVIPLLREKVPFFLLKLDIKSFYESVNRAALLEQVFRDSSLSFRSKLLLDQLLATSQHFPGTGLPRGISLSATLSELYMKEFDAKIRSIDGVYFYTRFVDDILIFSFSEPNSVKKSLEANLPSGMNLNNEKECILGFDRNGNCNLFKDDPEYHILAINLYLGRPGALRNRLIHASP